MRKFAIAVFTLIFASAFLAENLYAIQRGVRVPAKKPDGTTKVIELYSGYHALIVGCGDYQKGWPSLPNPVKDAREIAQTLKKMGFTVEVLENPDGAVFRRSLNKLIAGPGKDKNKGIFFWYSGHGHTLKEADGLNLGYLVPVDAPNPDYDEIGFMDKAVSMRQIETVAKRIHSKHVLMAFDSCFSGAIFRTVRAKPSAFIQEKVSEPVRQFITAGNENEQVPDRSIFKDIFIQGVSKGYADRNNDSYVSGEELGTYLHEEVVNYSRKGQHPQFGKINNPKLDKGDFIFQLASSSGATVEEPAKTINKTTLSIDANISGANVLIDGRSVGTTNLNDVDISPGEHRIRVEKGGYEPYSKTVRLGEGRSMSLFIHLEAEALIKSSLYVDTQPPDAKIRILNIVPKFHQGIELDPGKYHLEVSADGYDTEKKWIDLGSGKDKNVNIRLKKASSPKRRGFANSLGMNFVYINPGKFMMGSPSTEPGRGSDEPQHRVTLTKGYYLQTTEVTQGQWKAVMGKNPSHFNDCGDDCPVEKVSWYDIREYIKKLNQLESTGKYRLPTEAEWEYACRAGKKAPFSFGNCLSAAQANYDGNYPLSGCSKGQYRKKTIPVASLAPNDWGLYDMHGNVSEWCQDRYGNYPSGSISDPTGPRSGSPRVFRGGSWDHFAKRARSAHRLSNEPGLRYYSNGFRLAASPGQ